MKFLLIAVLKLYRRYGSPHLGGGCRYQPSCSAYALDCIQRYGSLLGLRLSVARLRRCNPRHARGRDPVPTPDSIKAALAGNLVEPATGRNTG